MYLKEVVIENSGPLKWLNLSLSFSDSGQPKPLVLVGGNGSGKTNFLSLVTDALFEAAAVHYDDVLPTRGRGRAWFRTVGGRNMTVGSTGSFSLLRFDDAGTLRMYKEKAGSVDPLTASARLPASLAGQMTWQAEGSIKEFNIDDNRSENLFAQGVYCYFPSSRSEPPYWLNQSAVPKMEFQAGPLFSKKLPNPIIVENGLYQFKQWLLSVLADARTEIVPDKEGNTGAWLVSGNPYYAMESSVTLEACNSLLQAVLNEPTARFVWRGRKSSEKVSVLVNGAIALPDLDAFSTGQALMLGMFGTILRYGDLAHVGSGLEADLFNGICIIDEIDSHMHVDVQYKTLPKLVKMFPSIQFIITSHSPIFVLGMEREFGPEGIQLVSMPNGVPVGAEAYSDFTAALDALSGSHSFTQRVIAEAQAQQRPVVYVEGETDAPYLRRAAQLLGRVGLAALCDIEWIGSKDENGQGFHTGKDALKHTLSVFRSKPELVVRPILLLNDNDTRAPDQDIGNLFVRTLPVNHHNNKVKAGIENLLSEDSITDDFYQEKITHKQNGDTVTNRSLRKAALCAHLCQYGTVEQFAFFASALDIIESCFATSSLSQGNR